MENLIFLTISLTRGGAERVICNMCNEYFAKHYHVTIISLMAAKPEYELDSSIRLLTIDTEEEQYQQNMLVRFPRRRRALAKVLRELQKDGQTKALISFLPEPNFLACSLKGKCSFPVIISVRNDPVKEYAGTFRQTMMRLFYPKASGYVFQTRMARDYFKFSTHIMENSTVIPNPIARDFLNLAPAEKRNQEIVAVGRLEKQKNPMLLLRAFEKVRKKHPEYQLVFYGEGSLGKELEQEIRTKGLAHAVQLRGNTSDVKGAIREAALFVLASDYEGMPNALMEAMALGLPCISTDCPCGGSAFLIRDGENGWLVPVGEEEALARQMCEVLENPKKAWEAGCAAQEITKQLNPDVIYRTWDEMLQLCFKGYGQRK